MKAGFAEAPAVEDQFSKERLLHLFTSAPKAFWRHDVDISLSAAVKMAQMAQIGGVRSTFYLNPRSHFYNVFSSEGEHTIEAIRKAGHWLGLHCDYREGDPVDVALHDFRLLDVGYPHTFENKLSFHMPPPDVLWRDFDWFESAYASRWKGRYISDSRGAALEGDVTDDMQVSLHPEHWSL